MNFFLSELYNILFKKYNAKISKDIIFLKKFVKKSHIIIKLFIITQFLLFNIFSILKHFRIYSFLKKEERARLLSSLSKFNFFKTKKLIELIHAVICLQENNSEKIKKNSFFQSSINLNFVENIIIGSGPGGSITAKLIQESGKDSLIIEKGDAYNIPNKKHPHEEFLYKWKYAGAVSTIGSGLIQYSSGECLGGGSEINSGLFHEPTTNILRKKYINEFNHLLNYPAKLTVEQKNLKKYFINGCKKDSLKNETPKKFVNAHGKKNSMSKTILKDYSLNGGKILLNSEVIKIKKLKHNYRISILQKNEKKYINCKNIFVCCGAPYSFSLLKESNLISGKMENFHFHPMIKIIVKYRSKVNAPSSSDIINNQITEFYPNYIFGNAASGKAFLRMSTLSNSSAYKDVLDNYKKMTIFHSTFSFGKGQLINIPLAREFLIYYKFTDKDIKKVKEALINLTKFVFNSGAEYIYICDEKVTKVSSINKLNQVINNDKVLKLNLSAVHLLGGFKKNNGKYIDKNGKLNNHNIFINDSSLICENLLKNPQGTIMSLSLKNIKNIIKQNLI
jgi:hypothetical protein